MDLVRSDELFTSPVTGIQQTASRGGAYWRWTYEFKDLSLSERDIVQAFLTKCRGSLNSFKVTDPGNYQIKGSLSDWIDVFSGYGSFNVVAGSDTSLLKINSWFSHSIHYAPHITDEQMVRFEHRTRAVAENLQWFGEGVAGKVSSLETGKAYVQRIKHFQNPKVVSHKFWLTVSSGNFAYNAGSGPADRVSSSDNITVPFYTGADVSSYKLGVVEGLDAGVIGDYFQYADYRLSRCALVSNSENLFTKSNNFTHADWVKTRANVASGYGGKSPTGVTSGSWKFFVDAQVNTTHLLFQDVVKITSEDVYSTAVYVKASELNRFRIQVGNDQAYAYADVYAASGTIDSPTMVGAAIRAHTDIFDVGSGGYRCMISAVVDSQSLVYGRLWLQNDAGSIQFTGNGSDGIEIAHAQLRKFPFMGQYVETDATAVIGSGWQTGASLIVDGFDPGDIIKAGTRLEVVNRFHNPNSDYFERSEFKRVTEEVVAHREGWAILPIDPPIRNAPVTDRSFRIQSHLGETMHNPVIFDRPELKARLVGSTVQYIEKPLQMTDVVFSVGEELTSG